MKLCERAPEHIEFKLGPCRRSQACAAMHMCKYVPAQQFKDGEGWPGAVVLEKKTLGPIKNGNPFYGTNSRFLWEQTPFLWDQARVLKDQASFFMGPSPE